MSQNTFKISWSSGTTYTLYARRQKSKMVRCQIDFIRSISSQKSLTNGNLGIIDKRRIIKEKDEREDEESY